MSASRTAVVTGGSLGIGAHISGQLLEQGWTVHILARHASTSPVAAHPHAISHDVDVRDLDALQAVAKAISTRLGDTPLDALVCCAGVGYPTPLGEVTAAQYDELFATNVAGTIFTVREFAPRLADGTGVIVIMSSIAGRRGFAGWSLYCATKHALEGFAASIRDELRGRRIRVTSIQPGSVDTPSYAHLPAGAKTEFIDPAVVAALTIHAINLPATATVETVFVNNTAGDL
jgi:NAD(P)-dependent dehydrogenase (short-subunit alcohol dehydrogenase family)